MKVILNQDVKHLGEEGDVKNVANGYARNYLFPRNFALQKRKDSASLKDKLQSEVLTIIMPAGSNGKLYGAVTNQTVAEYLQKQGYDIERKRIEIPGSTIKSVGKYSAVVRLYETTSADISIIVKGQEQAEKEAAEAAKAADAAEKPAEEPKAE